MYIYSVIYIIWDSILCMIHCMGYRYIYIRICIHYTHNHIVVFKTYMIQSESVHFAIPQPSNRLPFHQQENYGK